MRFKTKLMFAMVLGLFAAVPAGLYLDGSAAAQAVETPTPTQQTRPEPSAEPKPEPKPEPTAAIYSYVAQPGDSYVQMSRKAIQTYGKKFKVSISQAGIVFAETNLGIAAGSPRLAVGQKMEIPESTVKEWVEKAKVLTPAQQAAWQYYVQFIDFNTDKVGEVR